MSYYETLWEWMDELMDGVPFLNKKQRKLLVKRPRPLWTLTEKELDELDRRVDAALEKAPRDVRLNKPSEEKDAFQGVNP
jgi:hypothetical protein